MANEKRYVVTMDFYVLAESDFAAVAEAHRLAKLQNDLLDNGSSIIDIVEQPFGTIGNRKVILTPNTNEDGK